MSLVSLILVFVGVLVLPAIMLWGLTIKLPTHTRSHLPNGDITGLIQKLNMLSLKSKSRRLN